MYQKRAFVPITLASATLLWSSTAFSDQITVTGPFHFLDNRSPNSINITPGLRQQFGAQDVVPNGGASPPTTGTASQGSNPVNQGITLAWTNFDTAPNFFSASRGSG